MRPRRGRAGLRELAPFWGAARWLVSLVRAGILATVRAMASLEPDPIPVSRTYAHALTGLIAAGIFVETILLSNKPWVGSKGHPSRFDWLASWGWDLRETTAGALLAYVALALVLYGISLGGQSSFSSAVERTRVRRSVGALGALLAISAASLTVFAVAGATAHPALGPALVVIIPTALFTWVFGVEVSRFVVPRHGRQLQMAKDQVALLDARLGLLPEHGLRVERALFDALIRALLVGAACATAGLTDGPMSFLPSFLIGSAYSFTARVVLVCITAENLVEQRRRSRIGRAATGWVFYVLIVLLSVSNMLAVAHQTVWAAATLLLVGGALPLFDRLGAPNVAGVGSRRSSLYYARAALQRASLTRQVRNAHQRLQQLEASHGSVQMPLRERLRRAALVVLDGQDQAR